MGCLWCEEEELAVQLIKILAANKELDKKTLRKAMPDLFLCLNCLYEYHRLKVKVIDSMEERRALLQFEYKRTDSHLKKVRAIQEKNDGIKEMLVDSNTASPMRNPILEMLCYPYLCLKELVMRSFVISLEWIIDHVQGSFFEPDAKYPGLYLLLINTSKKIKDWSAESIRMMPMISHEDFYVFRPLFNALLNLVSPSQSESNDIVLDKIIDKTFISHHLYDPLDIRTLWFAYSVIFNSLQSRVLKILLESNKNLFEQLYLVLKGENSVFWSGLCTFQILLEKLGTSFWLFSSRSDLATSIFSTIINNPMFTNLLNQYSDSHSSKNILQLENEVSSESLFSWFLPFLKTTVELDICGSVSFKMAQFLLVSIEKYKAVQKLYSVLLKSLIAIVSYLSEENSVHLFIGLSNQLARTLTFGCKKEETAYNLLNTLVVKSLGFKIITPEIKLKFTSNLKKMQQGKSFDVKIIRDILEKTFKVTPKMKEEPVDDKDSVVNQLKLQEDIGWSAEYPIKLDEDSDVGQFPDVVMIDVVSDEDLFDGNKEIKQEQVGFGSQSPIQISDDETEYELSGQTIDFSVGKNCNTVVTDLSERPNVTKLEAKSVQTITDTLRSKIGRFNRDIFNFHKNKVQSERAAAKDDVKVSSQEEDVSEETEKESQVYDLSSDISNNSLKHSLHAVKPANGGIKHKSFSSLRRERIEKDLTTPLAPIMKSKNKYTVRHFYRDILCWNTKWLEEKRDELKLEQTVDAVPFSFDSFDEYVKIFWPLMLMETWSQTIRDWSESEQISVDYVVDGIDDIRGFGKMCFIRCSYCKDDQGTSNQRYSGCPLDDDLVFLKFERQDCVEKVFGIVESTQFGKTSKQYGLYNLNVMIDAVSNLHSYKSVSVTRVTSLTTVSRQWNGIIEFQNSMLAKDILKPFRKNTFHLTDDKIEQNSRLKKLNPSQFRAASNVSRCVLKESSEIPRIVMLQGPPGTGKSYTIKTIITHLLQEWSNSNRCTGRNRILVCAPSNAAVDEIVKRLISSPPLRDVNTTSKKHGNCGDFNLLRLGRKMQVDYHVQHYTMEYLVEARLKKISLSRKKDVIRKELRRISQALDQLDNACVKLKMSSKPEEKKKYVLKMNERTILQQEYDEYNRLLEKASGKLDLKEEEARCQHNLLLQADIICCTLSGAGSKSMMQTFKRKYTRGIPPFACAIIDEAGQCCEPDALIPLQYSSSKLILVGDPAQLPATVLSQKATRYNYGQSLFERIFNSLTIVNEGDNRPAILLNLQYRMAPGICAFPSERFYNKELRPAREISDRKANPLKEYVVLNVLNSTEERCYSGSTHNPNERSYVLALCTDILKSVKMPQQAISVITPYRKQVALLRSELQASSLQHIKVNTIDGCQGQESDIVLLSCVRGTNYRSNIGFLKHPQRMNVALTRARNTLIILCNCETLEVDDDWKALIENARQRNVLYDVHNIEYAVRSIYSEDWKKGALPNVLSVNKKLANVGNPVQSSIDTDVVTNATELFDSNVDKANVEGETALKVEKKSDDIGKDSADQLQVPSKVRDLKIPVIGPSEGSNGAEVVTDKFKEARKVKKQVAHRDSLKENESGKDIICQPPACKVIDINFVETIGDKFVPGQNKPKRKAKKRKSYVLDSVQESDNGMVHNEEKEKTKNNVEKDEISELSVDKSETMNVNTDGKLVHNLEVKKKKKKSANKEKRTEDKPSEDLSSKHKVLCDEMESVPDVEIKLSLKLLQKKLKSSTDVKEQSELKSIASSLHTLRKDGDGIKTKRKSSESATANNEHVQSVVVDSPNPSLSSPTGSCLSIESETSSIDLNGHRKWKPSPAYFIFPHRHNDGTYCNVECVRVIQRKKLRRLTSEENPLGIPWKLISLVPEDMNHLDNREVPPPKEKIPNQLLLPLEPVSDKIVPKKPKSPIRTFPGRANQPAVQEIGTLQKKQTDPRINSSAGTFPDERPKKQQTDPRINRKLSINHQESLDNEPMEVTTLDPSPILLNAPVDFPESTLLCNSNTNNKRSSRNSNYSVTQGLPLIGSNTTNLTVQEYRTNFVAGFTAGILEKGGIPGNIDTLVNLVSNSVLGTDALEKIIPKQYPSQPSAFKPTNVVENTTKYTYRIPMIGSSVGIYDKNKNEPMVLITKGDQYNDGKIPSKQSISTSQMLSNKKDKPLHLDTQSFASIRSIPKPEYKHGVPVGVLAMQNSDVSNSHLTANRQSGPIGMGYFLSNWNTERSDKKSVECPTHIEETKDIQEERISQVENGKLHVTRRRKVSRWDSKELKRLRERSKDIKQDRLQQELGKADLPRRRKNKSFEPTTSFKELAKPTKMSKVVGELLMISSSSSSTGLYESTRFTERSNSFPPDECLREDRKRSRFKGKKHLERNERRKSQK